MRWLVQGSFNLSKEPAITFDPLWSPVMCAYHSCTRSSITENTSSAGNIDKTPSVLCPQGHGHQLPLRHIFCGVTYAVHLVASLPTLVLQLQALEQILKEKASRSFTMSLLSSPLWVYPPPDVTIHEKISQTSPSIFVYSSLLHSESTLHRMSPHMKRSHRPLPQYLYTPKDQRLAIFPSLDPTFPREKKQFGEPGRISWARL